MSLIPTSISSAVADRAKILGTLETLALGAAGGLLFQWANLPGGLISGAMAAVAIGALAGRPLHMPPILTQTVLVLLGITLGSLVSRQLIQHMSAYPLTIGLLALATLLLIPPLPCPEPESVASGTSSGATPAGTLPINSGPSGPGP